MSEYKETVTTSQEEHVPSTNGSTNQQTRQVSTRVNGGISTVLSNLVWLIIGIIEIALAARFVLKLLGANASNGFVEFIYSFSNIFSAPFDTIFGVTTVDVENVKSVLEPSILVAMSVYALIGWGVVKLLSLNRPIR